MCVYGWKSGYAVICWGPGGVGTREELGGVGYDWLTAYKARRRASLASGAAAGVLFVVGMAAGELVL